ncbi:cation diffusion facilitator family transporter [Phenylobacterium montanum]|uniref:Cation transporter n=1 Tax=Phenylobacterium montanum TaxID=2823693 RepID=A0A975FXX2_9CAUL|nr:cation diffusion facilitator family transporter [Caulobacter sp. S6]QUD87325.1 cation transporter [Caulobacter sp. S6]
MSAPEPAGLTVEESAALTRRITRLSLAVATVLSLAKIAAWINSGSVAMLASLADSALDMLAAATTFFAVRYAAEPPDREHRYGHGKAEAFGSLIQAGLVFASAALVGREAVDRLMHPEAVSNQVLDLWVMGASTGLTLLLVTAQSRVLRQAQSVAVTSDRTHYLVDIAANLVAFAGIGASMAIASPAPDALAGLIVAAWLVWGAVSVFRGASTELMDQELDRASRGRIIELMREDPRVRGVHQLRTRAAGPYIHIQMHCDLEPGLSLIDAHKIMVAAENRVLAAFPTADILIHPDPRGFAEPHGGPGFHEHHDGETTVSIH